MHHPALSVQALSKRYRIGAATVRSGTLKEALVRGALAPLRNLERLRRLSAFDGGDEPDVVWALRDVSFELAPGEVLGIIGRNGAGKSTLLKILSRITQPTSGRARVVGRVGSLLEVGTGFHPELTGRDNVFLNGSILGMNRADITKRFDQIVDFAGVGKFIDTPVKRYSSGMYLRLAFAVAAHLEPDVLIVDEVLAVGDFEFQQKCLRQMDEVAQHGRTVLFVSHNLNAVQRLCPRAILLEGGQVVADGDTARVLARYLATGDDVVPPGQWVNLATDRRAAGATFVAVWYGSPASVVDCHPYPGARLDIRVRIRATSPIPNVSLGFRLRDQSGFTLMSGSTIALGVKRPLADGVSTWLLRIASLSLRPGSYQLDLWLGDAVGIRDSLQPAIRLEVVDRTTSAWGPRFDPRCDGPVFCEYEVVPADGDGEPANPLLVDHCSGVHVGARAHESSQIVE